MATIGDPFRLHRFLDAQSTVIEQVLSELHAGRKTSHWMWFVFPQLSGLGSSSTAQYYAIHSRDEARAYLAHTVLGPRLLECVNLVNAVEKRTALQIFGSPDHLKFHSSITLFSLSDPGQPAFHNALARFFGATQDRLTLELLGSR